MEWFPQDATESEQQWVADLENTFGLEGYARWIKIKEILTKHSVEKGVSHVRFPWSRWQLLLKGKRKKLETFLKHLENISIINQKQNGNVLEISWPKLPKTKDSASLYKTYTTYNPYITETSSQVSKKSESESSKLPKPKIPKKLNFSPDDIEFAKKMRGDILDTNVAHMFSASEESWANDIRIMREKDKRRLGDALAVWVWAHGNHFWQPNILSPNKLREKYDQLMGKMARARASPDPQMNTSFERKREVVADFMNDDEPTGGQAHGFIEG